MQPQHHHPPSPRHVDHDGGDDDNGDIDDAHGDDDFDDNDRW